MGFADKVMKKAENKAADKIAGKIVNNVFGSGKSSSKSKVSKKETAREQKVYNSKKCHVCQALCINETARCPYCGADITTQPILSSKELEKEMKSRS